MNDRLDVPAAPYAVVIGGTNVDIKSQSAMPIVAATSNPGTTSVSVGGVGRNIAENLARLGTRTVLLSAVGADAHGALALAPTEGSGVDISRVITGHSPTGTYTAVLDHHGELVVAVADMAATDAVTAAYVAAHGALVDHAAFVILDANLAVDTAVAVLRRTRAAGVPTLLDPVSDPKAQRLSVMFAADPVADPGAVPAVITPNRSELGRLAGIDTATEIEPAVARLHACGVDTVWVRLGAAGSVLSASGAAHRLPAVGGDVVDVTGAGDAMAGAYVHALLRGRSSIDAARFAQAAAALTIESVSTVRADLTEAMVDDRLRTYECLHGGTS